MLCGPIALHRATGIPVETVITRIRFYREQEGRRLSLRGGTYSRELVFAAQCEGWRMRRVFDGRRVPLKHLVRRISRGRFVFRQSGHFFGVASAKELRRESRYCPNARPIVAAWILYRP